MLWQTKPGLSSLGSVMPSRLIRTRPIFGPFTFHIEFILLSWLYSCDILIRNWLLAASLTRMWSTQWLLDTLLEK
jgi:hypothetical protein